MFKVCFIGVGSIAKRHIKNLYQIFEEKGEKIQISAVRSGKGQPLPEDIAFCIKYVYGSVDELPDHFDVIFITNPTEQHLETLERVHDKAKSFFIEKPIASIGKIKAMQQFLCDKEKVYYVACPLRYTSVIKFLKEKIENYTVYSVRCISSSYLPDWRPDIDYRETYSAKRELGGGVSIDLIHEWDYIKYLFGKPASVYKSIRKVSNLEIDSDDIAAYLAEYTDKTVELHLDYFGRKAIREIQVFAKEDTIICDLIHSKICFLTQGKTIELQETRDEFQREELKCFLEIINKKQKNMNTIKDACDTLLLTQGVVK